jgi:maltose alpha-D-glucosyltransferase/alpha-amylase
MLTLPGHGFYWFELAESANVPSWHEERLAPEEKPWLVLAQGLASFESGDRRGTGARLVAQLESELVPASLAAQRWFAGKETGIESTALLSSCLWRSEHGTWLLAFVEARLVGGDMQEYFLPLGVEWGPERPSARTAHTLARVRQHANTGIMFDAFADPAFVRDLIASLGTEESVGCGGGTMRFIATSALPALLPKKLDESSFRLAADSSNFTAVIGERLFVKAFRRLRTGVHPEWELGRFLTERSPCSAIVPTAGAIVIDHAGGDSTTVALVQAAVANQGDGWRYTQQYLERTIDDAIGRSPDGQRLEADHSAHLLLVRALARRTAELHRALAVETGDPAFDPEPIDPAHLDAWTSRVHAEIDATLEALAARTPTLAEDARSAASDVIAAAPALRKWLAGAAREPVDAVQTRYHGDFHLGQVLLTRNDFLITDLEGEPGRTLAERRRKGSALKDVAGMLRSFDYAGAVTARQLTSRQQVDGRLVERLLEEWRSLARSTFLSAYREAIGDCRVFPREQAQAERLLRIAAIERLFYEIRYELEHRPDWVAVPLRDLRTALDG